MSGEDIKPGYKRTEVGVIPEDWEVVPLSSLAEFITSGSRGWATYYADHGALFVRSQNVRDGWLDFADKQFVNAPLGAEGNRTRLKRSDLLITITGNSVGNVALVEAELGEAYISQHVGLVRLSDPLLGPYICRFLAPGSVGNEQIFASQSGQSKPGLSLKNLHEFLVFLPPAPEQRAIATALSDVDALLAKLDQLIAKKRDLKQATMQQLLTGQTRLPGFSGAWEVKRLGDLASLKNGYTFKSETYSPLGCYKVITIANVQDGYMVLDDCNSVDKTPSDIQPHQLLKIGEILISMTGNVGRICRVSEDFCLLNQRVGKMVPTLVQDDFLFALLRQPSFIASMSTAAKGGAQPNLSAADIGGYEFSIPADAAEQTAIAKVLSDMDAELAALQARRDKTHTLKQGMMQELLTGRIRLI